MSLLDTGLAALIAPSDRPVRLSAWLVGALALAGLAVAGMTRLQHPGFGTELRALITSKKREEKEAAAAIVKALEELAVARAEGRLHPDEDAMTNNNILSGIRYLRLYPSGQSIRVYFTVTNDRIWLLGINPSKRTTTMTSAMKDLLSSRMSDVLELERAG